VKLHVVNLTSGCALLACAASALAQPATPGYPERVLQWTVQEGETCADISTALYGDPRHTDLVERYNALSCSESKPIAAGTTLVLPDKVTTLPTASLKSMAPSVRARPAGGSWQPASPGMPLYRNDNVNTLDRARADIRFVDRTRVVLAEHTLVVIFGTAAQTRVSRTDPAAVQLDEGEVEAGLAALAGRSVGIAVQGGARVDAASRDTVVRKKPARTTVSVFDGAAKVQSAGTTVDVPENNGSSFQPSRPPTPPRPLPPPASWAPGSPGGVRLAVDSHATIDASWGPVDRAVAYRIEVAVDPEFHDLVAREEVPATVRSFRGDRLPPGVYHLRVRAIDDEDYLGLSTSTLTFTIVGCRVDGGAPRSPSGGVWKLHPYAVVSFDAAKNVELSVDGRPFGPLPARIDLSTLAPTSLAFRPGGAADAVSYRIDYERVDARIALDGCRGGTPCKAIVTLSGSGDIDTQARIGPRLMYAAAGRTLQVPLFSTGPGAFAGTLQEPPAGTITVVDRLGRVLGRLDESAAPRSTSIASTTPARGPHLGVEAPMLALSTMTSALWWSPAPAPAFHLGGTGTHTTAGYGAQAHMHGVANLGRVSLDALIPTPPMADAIAADSAGWMGARVRMTDGAHDDLAVGTMLRVGLPLAADGPPARLETGVAAGKTYGTFGWLANLGFRDRFEAGPRRAPAPSSQAFLLAGVTWDLTPAIRTWALIDSSLLRVRDDSLARGGVAAGIEAGTTWFGSLGVRGSGWEQAGGLLSAQIAVGTRVW